MVELRRFLPSRGGFARRHEVDSTYPGDMNVEGVEVEYHELVERQVRRLGVDPSCVSIEIRRKGKAADGLCVFVAMIQLTAWERESALRVLLGLPMLDSKVRQAVDTAWMSDVSHFAGVWLSASPALRENKGIGELRNLLVQLAPAPRASLPDGADASETTPASLP
jgi:hypothetical protein